VLRALLALACSRRVSPVSNLIDRHLPCDEVSVSTSTCGAYLLANGQDAELMHYSEPNLTRTLRQAFLQGLDLPSDIEVDALVFEEHPHWDSLGHMTLVAEIEEKFGLTLNGDEIMRMDSFAAAIEIVAARNELLREMGDTTNPTALRDERARGG
jgi:acyl carrier protein